MANIVGNFSQGMITSPSISFVTIASSDSVNSPSGGFRGIYVGGGGDIAVVADDDTVAIFTAVPQGTVLPVVGKRVNSTNTTASLMIGLR